jgi:hypothetical protein
MNKCKEKKALQTIKRVTKNIALSDFIPLVTDMILIMDTNIAKKYNIMYKRDSNMIHSALYKLLESGDKTFKGRHMIDEEQ